MPVQTLSLSPYVQVHVAQKDKEECVQRYDDAFTFYYGTWDAALEAGYTCARPQLTHICVRFPLLAGRPADSAPLGCSSG